MNITTQNTDTLNAEIKITITKEDYETTVNQALRNHGKKASMPGFRPGKIPFGLLKKMYGDVIFIDEVNKIVEKELFAHIDSNKLKIFGSPLPNPDKSSPIGKYEDLPSLELIWDIGLEPEFSVNLSDKIKSDFYSIKVDEKEVERLENEMRKRYGNYTNPDTTEEGDLIYGDIVELNDAGEPLENGIKNRTSLFIEFIADKATKKSFVGKKKDDVVVFEPMKAMKSEVEVSSMLNITKDEAKKLKSKFSFTIAGISRVELAELNEEFFQKVYFGKNIENEEQLRAQIAQDAEKTYNKEAERLFTRNVLDQIKEKLNLSLPDAFIKRWMVETDTENKLTAEEVEKQYDFYSDMLKTQLIQSKILEENNVKVEPEDVDNYLETLIREQFASFIDKQENPDEAIKIFKQNIRQNKEEIKRVVDIVLDNKLSDLLKEKINVKKSEVTYEEFIKLAEKNKN